MLADLTLSSCQIGLDDKDKLVRYVLLSSPLLYCSGYHLIDGRESQLYLFSYNMSNILKVGNSW